MRIQHNIVALNTYNKLCIQSNVLSKSIEKLSSGLRINRAGDAAAGLAISEKMRGQIRGLNQASRNIQDGISLIQTAEGGMNEIHSLLQRGRELSVQVTDNPLVGFAEIWPDISSESSNSNSNSNSNSGLKLQLGANKGQTMSIVLHKVDVKSIGIDSVDVTTDAQDAISQFDQAIKTVSSYRSDLGAYQNRLEHALSVNQNTSENLTSAESRIRDADLAKEMMNQTKNSILSQAAQTMLAQANQQPQGVLQLLR